VRDDFGRRKFGGNFQFDLTELPRRFGIPIVLFSRGLRFVVVFIMLKICLIRCHMSESTAVVNHFF
jgi:hypothetical protein